ncbi:MAG: hypothetical protein ACFFAK_15660 [Promethearchaeota archaeon]
MTKLDGEGFLDKLYEVVFKLSGISKTQSYRFKKEWDENLIQLNKNPHLVRQIPVEKDKFLQDIEYRIKVLDEVRLSFEDGFHSIKTLLTTLYQLYFNDSKRFKEDFSNHDQLLLKYFVAKKILGDLVQYNQLDHESVPFKYNLIARNYIRMKLNGLREKEILENLKKVNIDITLPGLRKVLKEVIKDGIIKRTKKKKLIYYVTNKELELSEVGNKKFNQTLRPLVEWPTLFWRSYYNIRELNVSVEGNIEYPEFLNKILEKAATQGYIASHYVFKNLVKYYEKIKADLN